ncbi:FAD/NAD-binding domain-containing protein [Phellopilus nigrolimitatus]|nr:FAD/NAD-binding domain-containing protein [Phellopilus nigrolimitatus]
MSVCPTSSFCSFLHVALHSGGGIGGLALALFLAAKRSDSAYPNDLDVAIYEAAPSLTELGAGVGVWLRTWRILSSVRFADGEALARDLAAIAPQGRDMSEGLRKAFEFRKGDGGPEGLSFYTMRVPFGVLTLHRADFQQAIARHAVPPATAHFGKRLVGYTYADESDSELILQFADGSTARADVLIGADGIRSAVRREMVRRLATRGELVLDPVSDLVEPVWSGTVVYRYLIPRAALEARFPGHRAGQGPVVYFGKDKHVLAFPIVHSGPGVFAAGETTPTPMVNLVAFVSEPEREGTRISGTWVRPAPAVDLLAAFEGWEDEVRALLELTEEPLLWAIHTVKPLPRYSDSNGRVVLLGDAAHAMTPHQGAGGGQAIEDAQVLAALLAHPRTTRETMPAVLRAYDAVRVPVAREVVRTSRLNGMMYEFNHGWDEVSDAEATTPGSVNPEGEEFRRLRRHAEAIMAIHDWEWTDAPAESQPAQAVRLFQEMLVEAAAKTDT